MKIVTVPETPKALKDVQGDPPDFKKWLVFHLDSYEAVRTPTQIRQAAKIVGLIEEANGTIAFEDADLEVVKGALQKTPYAPRVSRQLLGYYDAIDKAEEVKK